MTLLLLRKNLMFSLHLIQIQMRFLLTLKSISTSPEMDVFHMSEKLIEAKYFPRYYDNSI